MLSPEQIDKLANHVLCRRDKRRITFSVLTLYALAVTASYALPLLGAAVPAGVLENVQGLAEVVVVAHLTASVATRGAAAWAAKKS